MRGSAKETRDIIEVGLGFLPHKDNCSVRQHKEAEVNMSNRTRRSIGEDESEGPIDTWSALPFIGRWNHWLTGVQDDKAGEVINLNYKNIGILKDVNVRYNKILNASARIQ